MDERIILAQEDEIVSDEALEDVDPSADTDDALSDEALEDVNGGLSFAHPTNLKRARKQY